MEETYRDRVARLAARERRLAILKFLNQLEILDARICYEFESFRTHQPPLHINDIPMLLLDLETFYTVAHNLLEVVANHLSKRDKTKFQKEPVYKDIAVLRNHLVRHAYIDRPGNDPYGGFGWSDLEGPTLKAGSPHSTRRDKGFFVNRNALSELLEKYQAGFLALGEGWPRSQRVLR